jgi:hypothetical protein
MTDEERQAPATAQAASVAAVAAASDVGGPVDDAEETVTFDSSSGDGVATGETEQEEPSELFDKKEEDTSAPASKPTPKRSESDYEMVGDESSGYDVAGAINDDGVPLEEANYELDELEAEIARELEDD